LVRRGRKWQGHANLKQLEEQLGYTTITSPIDGIILSRDVEVGDAVSSILCWIVGHAHHDEGDTSEVYVKARWRERYRQGLHGSHADQVESFKDRLQRQVTKISPMAWRRTTSRPSKFGFHQQSGGELKAA